METVLGPTWQVCGELFFISLSNIFCLFLFYSQNIFVSGARAARARVSAVQPGAGPGRGDGRVGAAPGEGGGAAGEGDRAPGRHEDQLPAKQIQGRMLL